MEDELHFLFRCPSLKDGRTGVLDLGFDDEEKEEKSEEEYIECLQGMLREESLKEFIECLDILFNKRQRVLYK